MTDLVEMVSWFLEGRSLGAAEYLLKAIEAKGYKIVPVQPTEEMERGGCFALDKAAEALMAASLSGDRHAIARTKMRLRWAAMLAASPKVTT